MVELSAPFDIDENRQFGETAARWTSNRPWPRREDGAALGIRSALGNKEVLPP
jgi:hypothetical protein